MLPSHLLTIPLLNLTTLDCVSILTGSLLVRKGAILAGEKSGVCYAHADFEKASRMIFETDWDALFSEDVDLYCIQWQQTFLSIMEECIPKKVLPPRRCNLPWLNKTLVQSMHRRNCIFRKAKRTNNALYNSNYKCARNRVISQLRQAK